MGEQRYPLQEKVIGGLTEETLAKWRENLDALRAELPPREDTEPTLRGFADDEVRAAMLAELERRKAQRCVPLVRAAGEAVPNSDAPAITPDMVWSGDFETLVSLFHISLHRVNFLAQIIGERRSYRCGPIGMLAAIQRTSGQPGRHLTLSRARGFGRTAAANKVIASNALAQDALRRAADMLRHWDSPQRATHEQP